MASEDGGMLKWVTIFDKKNEKDNFGVKIPELPEDDGDGAANGLQNGDAKKSKSNKRLSVERIYQKKTQLEHILLRPDTYIGSVETVTQPMWVYDDEGECMVQRDLTFVPGLYKIFDEILVNAADNKQRDPKMNCIKIDIDPEANKIKIWNNGKGIPIVKHKTEQMYVPTLIFGHLLTSSNYDDSEKKVTGGRNGYGAKLCNIFSSRFSVETQCGEYKSAFRQSWMNNMGKAGDPKILPSKGEDYTCITFYPDLERFKMAKLDKDTVDLFARRAYDIAGAVKGVKVFLNGKKVGVKNFKDYIDLYIKNKVDDNGMPIKLCHEIVNERWEVGIALSEKGFQQASFVNSIATTKGGRHVDYVTDQCVSKLIETVKKKEKKGGVTQIKPFQVKTHLWIFCNTLIENPTFDSQTKENMTLQAKSFGSKCAISEKFINQMAKCGIVESIQSWMKFKAQEKMNKKCSSAKHSKLKGIPKLDDANNAGTKNSMECTLILTEGDSAKSLAVSGLGVVGRDRYGVFPLRGKLLNVREASPKQIMENAEINNLIKIMGLRYKEKYEDPDTLKTLRYGKIMIMTDQDQDGSHIKGLLVNFIHNNWPGLLKHKFLEEFITPIVKVTKNKVEKSFYSLPEFEEWKKATDNWQTYKVKYYKGLGTSSSKEAKEYFSDMDRHRIPFKYAGPEDDASILLAFSKKKIEERKEWLTNWMEERKRRDQLELPELYLYGTETKSISYNEFVNRELILFSNMDNERSIPCLVDGLKPGQRKVLFTCFKRNLVKEMKVAQLAGSVAEHSAYHHGEMSLMMTIINLAQNFVGSNNINLLTPNGQFGTRLHGGKDAASPRYIFTQLSTLARHIYNVNDEALLKYNFDDGQRIEPNWYIPIIPMVLVNGAEGIGTGWSTKIPNYDPREVVRNLIRILDGMEPQPMSPWFKGFVGTVESIDDIRDAVSGEVSVIDDTTIEITELPVRTWTQQYKEGVLEPMLQGTDKTPALIQDYKEYHTDKTVKFVITMSREKLAQSEATGLHKVFKLQTTISKGSMVLFDHDGVIKRYTDVVDILREFYTVRMDYYQRRKDYLEGMLSAESLRLDNIARFIMEKIEGTIVIENKPKKELIQMLVRRGYDSDPVKTWKATQVKLMAAEANEDDDDDSSSVASEAGSGPDFNYLLGMALWCLTKEKKDELLKNRDAKTEELYQLRKKTPSDLWRIDLDALLKELDAVEAQEKKDDEMTITKQVKTAKGRAKSHKITMDETKPSFGRRIEPVIDAALKAKVEAAARAKNRKNAKKEKEEMDMDFLDDDEEGGTSMSLADRIGGSPTAVGGAAVKKEKKPKEPKAPKEKKEKKPPRERKPSGKKGAGKKKNPWSDSESNEEFSDSDDDMAPSNTISPVQRSPRRAATKAKYTYSDAESEEGFKSTDDEFSSKPAKKAVKFSDSEGDYDDDEDDVKPPPKKAAPEPKPRAPSPVLDSESDADSYKPSAQTTAPAAAVTDAFPASPVMLDDSDDEELFPVIEKAPAKKPAAPKKPAAKKKVDEKQPSIFDAISKTKPTKDVSSDEENGVDDWLAITKPTITKKAAKKPAKFDSDSDDDMPKKSAPKKKAAPKKKKSSDLSDFSDEELAPKPKKAPAKKRKPKKDLSDFSDLSDDAKPAKAKKPKTKAARKKKPGSSDEDDFDMDFDPAPATSRTGRATKPVKYNFGESDDDSDY